MKLKLFLFLLGLGLLFAAAIVSIPGIQWILFVLGITCFVVTFILRKDN